MLAALLSLLLLLQPSEIDPGALLIHVNQARLEAGVPALVWSPELTWAAGMHAEDMVSNSYFAHTSPEGVTVADRVWAAGYPVIYLGEALAWGYTEPDVLTEAWMASAPHRQVLLDPEFRDVGIWVAGGYTVMILGAR